MIRVTHLINAGPYQHVEVTFEEKDAATLLEVYERDFTNEFQRTLGKYQTEAESWIKGTREDILAGIQDDAVATAKALGATVVAEEDTPDPEPPPAWEEPVEAAPKAWQEKPAETDTDDEEDW